MKGNIFAASELRHNQKLGQNQGEEQKRLPSIYASKGGDRIAKGIFRSRGRAEESGVSPFRNVKGALHP